MSKVELKSSNLKSGCNLYLKDAISSINNALNYYSNIEVPSDFSKKNDLTNAINKLIKSKEELEYVKDWVNNSCDNYDKLITNLNIQANKLPINSVKIRNNII